MGNAYALETPTTTAYNLTEELEKSLALDSGEHRASAKSLDLNSAVKGDRIVTAVEVMCLSSAPFVPSFSFLG